MAVKATRKTTRKPSRTAKNLTLNKESLRDLAPGKRRDVQGGKLPLSLAFSRAGDCTVTCPKV